MSQTLEPMERTGQAEGNMGEVIIPRSTFQTETQGTDRDGQADRPLRVLSELLELTQQGQFRQK